MCFLVAAGPASFPWPHKTLRSSGAGCQRRNPTLWMGFYPAHCECSRHWTDADTEIPSFLRGSDDIAFSRALRMCSEPEMPIWFFAQLILNCLWINLCAKLLAFQNKPFIKSNAIIWDLIYHNIYLFILNPFQDQLSNSPLAWIK